MISAHTRNLFLLSAQRLDRTCDVAITGFTSVDRQAILLTEDDLLGSSVDELAFAGVARRSRLQDERRSFDFLASILNTDAEIIFLVSEEITRINF